MFLLKRKILIPIILFLLLLFAAWRGGILDFSKGLDEDKFVKVYAELSLVQEQYRSQPSQLSLEKKKIFEKYKVNEKELLAFVKDTKKDGGKWVGIWEKVIRRLRELQKEEYTK